MTPGWAQNNEYFEKSPTYANYPDQKKKNESSQRTFFFINNNRKNKTFHVALYETIIRTFTLVRARETGFYPRYDTLPYPMDLHWYTFYRAIDDD